MNNSLACKPLSLITLILSGILFSQVSLADQPEKIVKDAEKCLKAAIKEEKKKPKPRSLNVANSCAEELKALLAYVESDEFRNTPDSSKPGLAIGKREKLESIN